MGAKYIHLRVRGSQATSLTHSFGNIHVDYVISKGGGRFLPKAEIGKILSFSGRYKDWTICF